VDWSTRVPLLCRSASGAHRGFLQQFTRVQCGLSICLLARKTFSNTMMSRACHCSYVLATFLAWFNIHLISLAPGHDNQSFSEHVIQNLLLLLLLLTYVSWGPMEGQHTPEIDNRNAYSTKASNFHAHHVSHPPHNFECTGACEKCLPGEQRSAS